MFTNPPTSSTLSRVLGFLVFTCFGGSLLLSSSALGADLGSRSRLGPVQSFSLRDVRLLEGPFLHATELDRAYLLKLEPDRFLAWFRREAGLEPKAQVYGGWESRGVAGHCLGHYLSACALMFQTTGDTRFRDRIEYIVSELAACQKANGNGYLCAFPKGKTIFAEVARGDIRSQGFDLNGGWVPFYTIHKVLAGLRDSYRLADSRNALEVEKQFAAWIDTTLAKLSHDEMQRILRCEHGGMNEVLADLYADTRDERFLALSKRFHHEAVLGPLAKGVDQLNGLHANTQIPKLVGLARRYELTGDASDRAAAEFFWERVVNHHSYVTGGHCIAEHFGAPDKLNDRLGPLTTETCNVYNMLKLTEHLLQWEADAKAGDFYERALFNHILSSQHPGDGRVIYNLSLAMGGAKEYQSQFDGFTCCVGSGMENHAKYGTAVYFHNQDSLLVNLYLASEVSWREKGVTLRQETRFPDEDTVRFQVHCAKVTPFALQLRHPYWAKKGVVVKVNGKRWSQTSSPSSWIPIAREWKEGDRVELTMPRSLRLETMPDNPNRVAVLQGPLVLAGVLGAVDAPAAKNPDFVPVLVTANRPPNRWLKPVPSQPCTFVTEGVGRPRNITFQPFFRVHDLRYSVYFDTFTEGQWGARQAEYKAEEARKKDLLARTVDYFQPGEMQPERDHNMQGEKTTSGEAMGRKWRHASEGGWFSFDVQVAAGQAQSLVCTFWGSDAGNRVFDILVDGQKIATQTLENNKPGQFYEVTFPIPTDFIQGKAKATIRFQAHPGKMAGGLYGARILKTAPSQN